MPATRPAPPGETSPRWFVLKQGKIFWFKSDIVTPVRAAGGGSGAGL